VFKNTEYEEVKDKSKSSSKKTPKNEKTTQYILYEIFPNKPTPIERKKLTYD
jgi:hypothetical protein